MQLSTRFAALAPIPFRSFLAVLGAAAICVSALPVYAQQPVAAAQFHPPAERPDSASMQPLQIPSHGALLNTFAYVAAGKGPHPAVILLHGLPGNERNLDLGQDIRRAGWDVLYLDYRGSWGSPGEFSFSHSIEDVAAVISYLREPSVKAMLRLDPQRLVLVGHSMGGFLAVEAAAADPSIVAVGLISPVDFGGMVPPSLTKEQESVALPGISAGIAHQGLAPLSGCTPDGLARDILLHAAEWSFSSKADSLRSRPILLITSDDGWAASNDVFANHLLVAGNKLVTTKHLSTDHSYSDQRTVLSMQFTNWLAGLPRPGNLSAAP